MSLLIFFYPQILIESFLSYIKSSSFSLAHLTSSTAKHELARKQFTNIEKINFHRCELRRVLFSLLYHPSHVVSSKKSFSFRSLQLLLADAQEDSRRFMIIKILIFFFIVFWREMNEKLRFITF